jgi:hypothetical protein
MEYTEIKNKHVSINLNNIEKTFEFEIKRACTVFKHLLDRYPDWLDIHELDGTLNDPNRAMSDLKNDDGYAYFIEERRNDIRNLEYRIKLSELFEQYKDKNNICLSVSVRQGPSKQLQKTLKKSHDSRCNITGIKLTNKLPANSFFKNLQIMQFDHRIPLFKGGDGNPNSPENWQLLSELANREKNKLCNICKQEECIKCALAYPEKSKIIGSNDQDISDILNSFKKID